MNSKIYAGRPLPIPVIAVLTASISNFVGWEIYFFIGCYIFGGDSLKGGRAGSFMLGSLFSFFTTLALGGATLLASPMLLSPGHVTKASHAILLTLVASTASYGLWLTGITIHLAALMDFHNNLRDTYEPLVAIAIVHFGIFAVLSILYRVCLSRNVA